MVPSENTPTDALITVDTHQRLVDALRNPPEALGRGGIPLMAERSGSRIVGRGGTHQSAARAGAMRGVSTPRMRHHFGVGVPEPSHWAATRSRPA